MRPTGLLMLVLTATLTGCAGSEQATENPPPRGEQFPGVATPQAPAAGHT